MYLHVQLEVSRYLCIPRILRAQRLVVLQYINSVFKIHSFIFGHPGASLLCVGFL